MFSPNATQADFESKALGFFFKVLPLTASIACLVVVKLLVSAGFDSPLVFTLGGIWLVMTLWFSWSYNRQKHGDSTPFDISPEIAEKLDPKLLKLHLIRASVVSSKTWWKISVTSEKGVVVDSALLSELSAEVAAQVIQLSYKARIFSATRAAAQLIIVWPIVSLIVLSDCKNLISFLLLIAVALFFSPIFLALSLLYQYLESYPVLLKSESDVKSLLAAQEFLESQPLPMLFPTSGWTRFKVWFSRMIVRREMRRFHHRARSDSSTG